MRSPRSNGCSPSGDRCGVGASVSPALFITGFSLRSAQIQRVFALVELLRGVTAFLVAPILLYLATAITFLVCSALAGERLPWPGLSGW